ncbi:CvpA family protein, partial [Salmonella enterica subsp. enterica serovar Montevideo]|nr:CvpA family protein [Salmonella enterica subsp. enterica serovar Montevideo]
MADFTLSKSLFSGKHRETSSTPGNIAYAIIAVIAFSCLVSLIRGFVREALSLVTWGCAFFVASHYYTY